MSFSCLIFVMSRCELTVRNSAYPCLHRVKGVFQCSKLYRRVSTMPVMVPVWRLVTTVSLTLQEFFNDPWREWCCFKTLGHVILFMSRKGCNRFANSSTPLLFRETEYFLKRCRRIRASYFCTWSRTVTGSERRGMPNCAVKIRFCAL